MINWFREEWCVAFEHGKFEVVLMAYPAGNKQKAVGILGLESKKLTGARVVDLKTIKVVTSA